MMSIHNYNYLIFDKKHLKDTLKETIASSMNGTRKTLCPPVEE